MLTIGKKARREFNGQALNNKQYEELLKISKNFCLSYEGTVNQLMVHPLFMDLRSDLIDFYFKERRLI
jgi:hypothetical protein